MTLCECGCGGEASPGRRFINGHWIRINNPMNNPESRKKVGDSKRGKPLSEETCKKMSESHKGKKRSKEYCNHMSELHKGQIPWNKGLTKETSEGVQKHAESMKGNQNMKGKHHSKETKEKISIGNKGKKMSENHKKIMIEFHTGRKRKKEICEKMSNAITKWHRDNPIIRKNHSEIMKSKWEDPEYVKKAQKALQIKPNHPETLIKNILENIGLKEYTINVKGEILIGRKIPDFINKKRKKLIELNGCYFHNCPICFPKGGVDKGVDGIEASKQRIEHFKKYGYDCLIVWEHELKDMKTIINKILSFHNTFLL